MNPMNILTIEIDGELFEIDQDMDDFNPTMDAKLLNRHPQNDETYELADGDISHRITVIEFDLLSRTCIIEIDGQVKQVRIIRELDRMIERMGLNSNRAKKQSSIVAPMPGLVTAIKIAAGDHVESGAPLLILEAMKMENVIAAPHDAVIKEIKVNLGQAVDRGFPLIEFS